MIKIERRFLNIMMRYTFDEEKHEKDMIHNEIRLVKNNNDMKHKNHKAGNAYIVQWRGISSRRQAPNKTSWGQSPIPPIITKYQ
jgi:hypothetical protein